MSSSEPKKSKKKREKESSSDGELHLISEMKNAIAESGLTIYQIAKATGVDKSALSRFVHGTRSLTLDSAAKVFSFLRLKVVKEYAPVE